VHDVFEFGMAGHLLGKSLFTSFSNNSARALKGRYNARHAPFSIHFLRESLKKMRLGLNIYPFLSTGCGKIQERASSN
jgi:hypothetical protein